ncbi:hypothetical protein [Sphingomonas suaedae]|uniref:hypothetical protein n=1 Tax=Sphingomonas suaedae TaxID=2599297 RepID=UPI001EF081CF|nr:hypothetical protein [Sphingomonas suaedae]
MSSDPEPADAGRGQAGPNPFDTDTGYSGQEYHRDREQELLDAEDRDQGAARPSAPEMIATPQHRPKRAIAPGSTR